MKKRYIVKGIMAEGDGCIINLLSSKGEEQILKIPYKDGVNINIGDNIELVVNLK